MAPQDVLPGFVSTNMAKMKAKMSVPSPRDFVKQVCGVVWSGLVCGVEWNDMEWMNALLTSVPAWLTSCYRRSTALASSR